MSATAIFGSICLLVGLLMYAYVKYDKLDNHGNPKVKLTKPTKLKIDKDGVTDVTDEK